MYTQTKRFIRVIPGRIRIEVLGLKHSPHLVNRLTHTLNNLPGVYKISACPLTGRVLLLFDECNLSIYQIIREIESFESTLRMEYSQRPTPSPNTVSPAELPENTPAIIAKESFPISYHHEAAAAMEGASMPFSHTTDGPPLPLVLTAGGLGFLGLKQLLTGKSALARSPAAFQLASLVSILSGYPNLRRSFSQLLPRRFNSDFVLSASALALAFARENLVVLAGLSLLQWLKWQKTQVIGINTNHSQLTEEIQVYSSSAEKRTFWIAGAAWALTQNPWIGLSVLLAGNPRVVTIPSEFAWSQAELTVRKQGGYIPENASLSEMARLKTVILEDTSLLLEQSRSEIQWQGPSENEADAWHLAASLMKKTQHSWLNEVLDKATELKGKVRAAFKVKVSELGTSATVHGSEILLGSLKFLQQNDVNCDPYLIEVKRARRHGFEVECIAKDKVFLGYLKKSEGHVHSDFSEALTGLHKEQVRLGFLRNSANLNPDFLNDLHLESIQEESLFEEATLARQQGQGIAILSTNETELQSPLNKLARISFKEFPQVLRSMRFARQMDIHIAQNFRFAKTWNILGITLGISNALTAPIINLIGDSLSLLLMARSKRFAENQYLNLNPITRESKKVKRARQEDWVLRTHNLTSEGAPQGLPSGVHWHNMSLTTLLERFEVTEINGLTEEKVLLLRNQYGANQLEPKKSTPWLQSYFGQFKEFTTLIILGTTLLAFLSGDIFDGLAMGTILLINAGIGTAQERKAEKVIEALTQYQPPTCKVLRDHSLYEIEGSHLVPGDIVLLEAGDRVPADLRLIKAWNLEASEAALTGESLPASKHIELLPPDCSLADRKNMLYMGTDVTRGKGIGLVVGTGMNTEIGYVMSLMKGQERLVTPLHEKVTQVSKNFVKWAALAGGIVFIVGLLRGRPLTQMIGTSITLAASAIPEGLPVTLTIALSAGVFRMAKKNALVRKLSAIETLGRTTVICTDKTGTLTKNEMTVKKIGTLKKSWSVSGDGYEPIGELQLVYSQVASASSQARTDLSDPDIQTLVRIGMLCNNSQLFEDNGPWNIKGDPTEGALLSLAGKLGYSPEKMLHWHRVHEVPFDSNSGSMSVVCQDNEKDQECFVFCKGSVETVLRHCHWVQIDGELSPLTPEIKQQILNQTNEFAEEALRVIGFAYSPTEWLDGQSFELSKELIYVGLVGMIDPPKAEVKKSLQVALSLGVKTVMITGDHPITAIAIAQKVGFGERATQVLTGIELDQLSDKMLAERVDEIAIFARVTPEHKLRIVKALQSRGHIVAMTGDGVNDTPAIKQSNVGIAMGKTGTEVTKATADMVLVHDSFNAIVEGVKEGRTIIGNIRKAIGCLLTGNLAEVLVTASAVIVGLPMPLVPIQILLMNLLTDAIPAMILAINPGNERGEAMITKRQDIVDRELYRKVITRGILLGGASLGLFAVTLASGAPLPIAQTVAFSTLVVGQLVQTLSWRKEGTAQVKSALKDQYLLMGLGGSFLALLSILYIPSLSRFFHAGPLGLNHWIAIFLIASLVSLVSKPFLDWTGKRITQGLNTRQIPNQPHSNFLVA